MKLKNLIESRKIYVFKPNHIQDGKLNWGDGRIVIYEDNIKASKNKADDHNYLLRALSSSNKLNKDKVIANAIRMYFREYKDGYVFNGVRKIDNEMFLNKKNFYINLIKGVLK